MALNKENTPVVITYRDQRSSTARIRQGKIILRISKYLSKQEKEKYIEDLLRKIKSSWERRRGGAARTEITPWELLKVPSCDEAKIPGIPSPETLQLATGQTYRVVIKEHGKKTYAIQKIGTTLFVLKPASDFILDVIRAEKTFWDFLAKDQLRPLKTKLDNLAEGWIEQRCTKVRMRLALTRWGSCDKRTGVIMLSPKLLLLEPKILDYVCIHELAHLKYADHSDIFWALVEQKMPDWKIQRRKLRQYE